MVIYLGELCRYVSFELPCHRTEGSTKHLFRRSKICAEQGWYKATFPSFSLENKMFFTVLSDSRALFPSSCEQTVCCYPALTQGCRLVGMFQVFLMHRRKTQSLEMSDLKTLWLQDMVCFPKWELGEGRAFVQQTWWQSCNLLAGQHFLMPALLETQSNNFELL